METYAAKLLKLVLDKSRQASFSEIRFIPGMSAAFVDEHGPHFLEVAHLSTELVGEIHQLCVLIADEAVSSSNALSTYTFTLRRLGRVVCKFQRRGNVASLIMVRDTDAAETVDAIRPATRPSLRAEAKPESKRKGNCFPKQTKGPRTFGAGSHSQRKYANLDPCFPKPPTCYLN